MAEYTAKPAKRLATESYKPKHPRRDPSVITPATQAIGLVDPTEAVRVLSRRYTAMAFSSLARICEHGKNESARVAAAKEILDRGWGRSTPMQHQEMRPGSNIQVVFGERPTVTVVEAKPDELADDDD